MYCKKCGAENKEGSKFCRVCGTPLKGNLSGNEDLETVSQNRKTPKRSVWKILIAVAMICVLAVGIGKAVGLIRREIKEKQYGDLIASAGKYLEELDYEKAEADYLKAIGIDPRQKEPYEKLVLIYQETNETEKIKNILQQGAEETQDQEMQKRYDLYTYVDDVLIPGIGKCGEGPFECEYKKTEYSCQVDSVHSESGVIITRIADFDNDGQDELLAATLENQTEREEIQGWKTNTVWLWMYESTASGITLTAKYQAFEQALGVGDLENEWIFFKTCKDTQYICGSYFHLYQITGDGLEAGMFAVSYQDGKFVERFHTDKMGYDVVDDPDRVVDVLQETGDFPKTVQWLQDREKHWGYPVNYVYFPTEENDGTFFMIAGQGALGGMKASMDEEEIQIMDEYHETGNAEVLGKMRVQIYPDEYQETEFSQWLEESKDTEKQEDAEASEAVQKSVQTAEVTLQREDHSVKDEDGNVVVDYYYDMAVLTETDDNPQFEKINQTLQEECNSFFAENGDMQDSYEVVPDERKQELVEAPFRCITTGQISCNQNGILSVKLTEEWYMGGVYNVNYHGENFDLETGERLELTDWFSMSEEETLEYLKNQTKAYMDGHPDAGWNSTAEETVNSYTLDQFEFYIEEDTVNLCYPTYELGYGATGPVVIPCPMI